MGTPEPFHNIELILHNLDTLNFSSKNCSIKQADSYHQLVATINSLPDTILKFFFSVECDEVYHKCLV